MKTKGTARRLLASVAMMAVLGSGVALAGSEFRAETELEGPRSRAGAMVGKAEFSERSDRARRKFSIDIERGNPGDMFDVMVSGVVVGKVLVDRFGIGEINYDDTAGPADRDQRFPRRFPKIDGGEVVRVGPLTGTMQLK